MPIRPIKTHSDRGSIKDVFNGESYEPPTADELRLKQLYEHAEITRDQQLQDSLGFIVMPQPGNSSAFPVSIFRHREYINSLSQKRADNIEKIRREISSFFAPVEKPSMNIRQSHFKQEISRQAVVANNGNLIKYASKDIKGKSSFKRVKT
jgi:hypothetical protein